LNLGSEGEITGREGNARFEILWLSDLHPGAFGVQEASEVKVRKGDLVQVLSGKDRGKQGRVLEARPRERRVVVENLNLVRRHTKPRPIRDSSRIGGAQIIPGGIIEKPAPLDVSNVMVVCPTCGQPTRVGSLLKDVKGEHLRVRVCKREGCGQELDK
jgi:large subunit ribosomal protein L24